MKRCIWKHCISKTLAACMILSSGAAAAQYPDKPVKIVVPFPAGGALDVVTRTVASKLSVRMNQPFIVENRVGAGGIIGTQLVAHSPPDGYTLLMGTVNTQAINPSLYPNLPYDPSKDFAPISLVASAPNILVVPAALGVDSVKQLLELARSKPDGLTYGSGGVGTTPHLAGALFAYIGKVSLRHVPYRGVPPAVTDLAANRISMMFANIPSALPLVRSGKLRVLGIASGKRSPLLPDVATLAEQGMDGYQAETWYGLLAPANTPPGIVAQLNKSVTTVLGEPQVQADFQKLGMTVLPSTSEEFSRTIHADTEKWANIVHLSGIKAN